MRAAPDPDMEISAGKACGGRFCVPMGQEAFQDVGCGCWRKDRPVSELVSRGRSSYDAGAQLRAPRGVARRLQMAQDAHSSRLAMLHTTDEVATRATWRTNLTRPQSLSGFDSCTPVPGRVGQEEEQFLSRSTRRRSVSAGQPATRMRSSGRLKLDTALTVIDPPDRRGRLSTRWTGWRRTSSRSSSAWPRAARSGR